jgi:hypothetical protein
VKSGSALANFRQGYLGRTVACEQGHQHDKLVRLRGPKGTDECNIGTARYTIHEDGFFYLPSEENIDGMLRVGGFTIAADQSQTVTLPAERVAELVAEEAVLLAAPRAPMRLTIPH